MAVKFTYPNGKTKALTFSYDDGTIADRKLVEIFNKYGMKGAFHLNSGLFGEERGRISADEIATLYKGHEVSCHSVSHPYLQTLPRESIVGEILDDRKNLEKAVGHPVVGLSYPYGTYDSNVKEILNALGIVYARTTKATADFAIPEDFLEWHPTCHHKDDILAKAEKFEKCGTRLPLFYVWGHSYEFDREDNWSLIEEFCEKLATDESIWKATNIDIYDYLNALKMVRLSANNETAVNMSAVPVWLNVDGENVKLSPNEVVSFV
jgi:peptidoglycan/xylan/chitin deacetylase (PgdA/CDA1 family)